jgi:bifunctional DNase/RNase
VPSAFGTRPSLIDYRSNAARRGDGIVLDPQSRSPIIVLRDTDERRALLIWIGAPEANAIMLVLEKIRLTRPATHDLMNNVLSALKATLQNICITDMQDNTFFAQLNMVIGERTLSVDARPSDAIALALRAGASVFVSETVMATSSIPIDQNRDEEEAEAFRRFVDELKPSDFGRPSG